MAATGTVAATTLDAAGLLTARNGSRRGIAAAVVTLIAAVALR